MLKGDTKALARAISMVENRDVRAQQLMKTLYPHTGHSYVIGITGPTGTGKSTLVDKMIVEYRGLGKTVAVLAVDPSSPFTGGALLGDRIRMLQHNLDKGVFIRSMASRGDIGGLARAAADVVRVLDASRKDIVIVETVGAGQTESEIVRVADATVIVLMPQMGDEIQALKAGLIELGDVFVVNKEDLPGVDRTFYNVAAQIRQKNGWKPPVIRTVAKTGKGLKELLEALESFQKFLASRPDRELVRRQKLAEELLKAVREELVASILDKIKRSRDFQKLVDLTLSKKKDPHSASKILLQSLLRSMGE